MRPCRARSERCAGRAETALRPGAGHRNYDNLGPHKALGQQKLDVNSLRRGLNFVHRLWYDQCLMPKRPARRHWLHKPICFSGQVCSVAFRDRPARAGCQGSRRLEDGFLRKRFPIGEPPASTSLGCKTHAGGEAGSVESRAVRMHDRADHGGDAWQLGVPEFPAGINQSQQTPNRRSQACGLTQRTQRIPGK